MTFQIELVSPEAITYQGEADMVIARTVGGGEGGRRVGPVGRQGRQGGRRCTGQGRCPPDRGRRRGLTNPLPPVAVPGWPTHARRVRTCAARTCLWFKGGGGARRGRDHVLRGWHPRLSDGGPLFDVRHPFVRRRRRAHAEGGVCEGAGLLPGGAWGGVSTDPGHSEMPAAGGREVVSVLGRGSPTAAAGPSCPRPGARASA